MTAETLLHDLASRGVRLIPTDDDRLTVDAPAGAVTEDDLAELRQHKADLLAALTPKPGTCPHCHDAADLQDRARDCWWCGGCGEFFDGQGQAIPPTTSPRPLTLEQIEAERLAVDLLAAGCCFIDVGDFFQTKLPRRITAGLLARLEAADRRELRHAAAKLADLEAAKGATAPATAI